MMYEGFAGAYDCLMADVDYDAWARHYLEIAAEMGVKVQRAADCACGTGAITLRLADAGIDMIGLDLSEEMLRRAGDAPSASGSSQPCVQTSWIKS